MLHKFEVTKRYFKLPESDQAKPSEGKEDVFQHVTMKDRFGRLFLIQRLGQIDKLTNYRAFPEQQ